jgi:multiple sugar transport system permease protein
MNPTSTNVSATGSVRAGTAAGPPHPARPRKLRRSSGKNGRYGILLTLPALVVLAVTIAYPIIWLVSLSLQSFSISADAQPAQFVGAANYGRIMSSGDFQNALAHTVGFVFVTLIVETLIAFPIALGLNRVMRGSRIFRVIVALPLMVAPVVAGMAWRFLFSDGYGLINSLLGEVGIHGPSWLSSAWAARSSVLVANLWLALPFDILVLLAGLANLPHDPFEAARIDGASAWQTFRFLTLPLLRPAILIILVVRLADAFRLFDLVYILTGGGPANSTDVLSTYTYRLMFNNVDFAGGAAASTLLTVITVVVAGVAVTVLRRKGA